MSKNLQNAKEAWKMGQVISAMNDEEAYYRSGWLFLWPDECSYEECLDTFSGDDSYFEELKDAYYKVFKKHHKDGLYKPERTGPDTIEFANETLKKLNIKGEFKETATNLWTVVTESLKEYAKEEMTEARAKEPKHLKELIAKLNASQTFEFEDGEKEVMESSFDFQLVERDGEWNLFDANESYHINYEEDMYYMMKELASEFAADKQEEESVFEDKIESQIAEAVKKDFGPDAHVEWQDNVTMVIVKNKKESVNQDITETKLTEAMNITIAELASLLEDIKSKQLFIEYVFSGIEKATAPEIDKMKKDINNLKEKISKLYGVNLESINNILRRTI